MQRVNRMMLKKEESTRAPETVVLIEPNKRETSLHAPDPMTNHALDLMTHHALIGLLQAMHVPNHTPTHGFFAPNNQNQQAQPPEQQINNNPTLYPTLDDM